MAIALLSIAIVAIIGVMGAGTWLIFNLSPYQQESDFEQGTFEVTTAIDYVDSWLTFEGEGIDSTLVQGKNYNLKLEIQHSRANYILNGNYELKFNTTTVMSGTITNLPNGENGTFIDTWTALETGIYNATLDLTTLAWLEQVIFTSIQTENTMSEPSWILIENFELLSPSMVNPGATVDFNATIQNKRDGLLKSYDYQISVNDGTGWTLLLDSKRDISPYLPLNGYDVYLGSFTAPSEGGQYILKFTISYGYY